MVEQVSNLKTGVKYKDTPIGKIPVDWEIQRLGNLCIGKPEYGANTSAIDKTDNLPRYVRITDITDDGRLLESTWQSIKRTFAKSYILKEGDLLFARSGATVGKTYLYKEEDGECAFAGYLIRFRTDPGLLLPEFLFNFTHSSYYHNWVKGMFRAGAQPNINANEYSNMFVPKPPIEEQKKIAEILTTVDKAIEKTTQIIERTKELKKGLMRKLFTEGIGHTMFKKTKIGRIPVQWEIKRFADLLSEGILSGIQDGNHGNDHPKASDYVTSGIPFIMANNIVNGSIDTIHCKFIRKEQADSLRIGFAKTGDILLSHKGTIGKVTVVPKIDEYLMLTPQVTYYRVGRPDKLLNVFLKYFMESERFQTILSRLSEQSTRKYIGITQQKKLLMAIPPLAEQCKMAGSLLELDTRIEKDVNHRDQLELLKKGLMQLLLTGRLRVAV
jgi:type I restriction enzyme S subunit